MFKPKSTLSPLFFTLGQSARQVAVRQKSGLSTEFHAKYGAPLMISGFAFCTAVWAYVSDCKHF